MEEEDYKKKIDVAIYGMQRLIETLEELLEKWSNNDYSNTEIGQNMIKALKEQIQEAKDEKQAYEQYKNTGVLITRYARKLLQHMKNIKDGKLPPDKYEEER